MDKTAVFGMVTKKAMTPEDVHKIQTLLYNTGVLNDCHNGYGELAGDNKAIRVFWDLHCGLDSNIAERIIKEALDKYWDWLPEFMLLIHDPVEGKFTWWHLHPGEFNPYWMMPDEVAGPRCIEMQNATQLMHEWSLRRQDAL